MGSNLLKVAHPKTFMSEVYEEKRGKDFEVEHLEGTELPLWASGMPRQLPGKAVLSYLLLDGRESGEDLIIVPMHSLLSSVLGLRGEL